MMLLSSRPKVWRLRHQLVLLLFITTVIIFVLVALGVLAIRVPQIERAGHLRAQNAADDVEVLLNTDLHTSESALAGLAALSSALPDAHVSLLFESYVAQHPEFAAVYLLSPSGKIVYYATSEEVDAHFDQLYGLDLSGNTLFKRALVADKPVWSGRFLSAVSGEVSVGIGVAAGNAVVIAELPLDKLRNEIQSWLHTMDEVVAVVDERGELIVHNRSQSANHSGNFGAHPLFVAALQNRLPSSPVELFGASVYSAFAWSERLNWLVLSGSYAGLRDRNYANTIMLVVVGFLGTCVVGLLLAPRWSQRLVRPVNALVDHAQRVAGGERLQEWPLSRVVEINRLSSDLQRMAEVIHERERNVELNRSQMNLLFELAPSAMLVAELGEDRLIAPEANQAWKNLFGYVPEQHLAGPEHAELMVWRSIQDRARFLEQLQQDGAVTQFLASLRDVQAQSIHCMVSGALVTQDGQRMCVISYENVTESLRLERNLRRANRQLEQRVAARSTELTQANQALSETVDVLNLAQGELVQAEKLAALGGMVAGIAHELNTPLGNTIMALSGLRAYTQEFRQLCESGLTRSKLDHYVSDVTEATLIAERNMERAVTLVGTFKQVAADRTSSQRRQFMLRDLVDEVLLTLRPTLKHLPYRVEVEVAEGIIMDSYPGALGQVLTNLIDNALKHGLAGRQTGTIRVGAEELNGEISLEVSDNGIGMDDNTKARIFDPFFTSRMGSGGTGLGMHIVFNQVTELLGGQVRVDSALGLGSRFVIRLPKSVPEAHH